MHPVVKEICAFEYINHEAIGNNLLLGSMYKAAYPFAMLARKLGLTPNILTSISLVFSILAFVSLVFSECAWLFCLFWGLTILTDFCDGTVARMTKTVNKTSFRYDHTSDLFKIFLVFLGAGIQYDSALIWIIAMSSSFLFMYYTVFDHDLDHARKKHSLLHPKITESVENVVRPKSFKDNIPGMTWLKKQNWLKKSYQAIWLIVFTINGHSLLLFFLVPFGTVPASVCFLYFGFMSAYGLVGLTKELLKLPK